MKKILHISNTDIYNDSRILKELMAIKNINQVTIEAIGVPKQQNSMYSYIDGVKYNQIVIRSRTLRFMPRVIAYFFELIEFTYKSVLIGYKIKANIFHCHDTFALPSGWILKKVLAGKLIYDAHELESNKNGQNYMLSLSTLLIEKFCWSKIDLLVSVSNSIIKWYLKKFSYKPNVLVLNSPILTTVPKYINKNLCVNKYFHEIFNISNHHLVFIYVGVLGPGRGIETYLDVFMSNINASVVFMGYGAYESKIKQLAMKNSNIHFHPPVTHDNVVPLISNADYGLCLIENVSLSDYYCLPNKLFEYSFARIPVVASNFPEIQNVVSKYNLGICCDNNSDSLKELIKKLINKNIIFVESDISQLSWDIQAKRLVDSYLNIIYNL